MRQPTKLDYTKADIEMLQDQALHAKHHIDYYRQQLRKIEAKIQELRKKL